MKKVKNIYFVEALVEKGYTGLLLELESGEMLKGCSSDVVKAFCHVTPEDIKAMSVKQYE
jgi:hypothetical protein